MANANLANPFASCSMKLKRAHYNLTVGIGPSSMCMRRIRRPSCRRNVLPPWERCGTLRKEFREAMSQGTPTFRADYS